MKALMDFYQKHGASKLLLMKPCKLTLRTGQEATLCYAMPKYKILFAIERPADLQAALMLGMAHTSEEVRQACANLQTGTYDIFRHMYLRQSFVNVYVTHSGAVVDCHRDFVRGGGHSEHSLFVKALHTQDYLDPLAQGPRSNQPAAAKPKPKAKWSARLKEMLQAPRHAAQQALMAEAAVPVRKRCWPTGALRVPA